MRKLLYAGCLLLWVIGVASCENNEGESIDFIIPNDSTQIAIDRDLK
ncbi:MAG: hypothetical protein AAFX53_03085 [Bacteroidota bacterium]